MRFGMLFALVALIAIAASGTLAAGQTNTVVAEGVAAVENDDLARAEDEALADAKRNAVEAAVGVFVRSETEGQNYQVIKDNILTRSEGYIASWRKIEGSRAVDKIEGSKLLRIKIEAKVNLLDVANDLMAIPDLLDEMERPRIVVMIKESNLGKVSSVDTNAGDGLVRALQDKGFDVYQAGYATDAAGRTRAAKARGADLVIIGEAKSEKASSDTSDIKSSAARLTAKVVWAQTGQILYAARPISASGASFSGLDDAAAKALATAGERLLDEDKARFVALVISRWADEVQNGRPLVVRAKGISYEDLGRLKNMVRSTRGFVQLLRETFENGLAEIVLRSKLSGSAFREKIAGANLGAKKVRIVSGCGAVTEIALR